ncbi:TonB-dependent receptor [Lutibacter sp.]|uniref:TonB-dependent receptor n=1 Tax=Lutibacter sp. TaxID=1925666 RepID=UPI00273295CA|nr:TonB-dependent receptor [Lutibacter sp.]MDP3312260.1 TonB-dependent receptor [Lutibacter sp.]
MKNLIISSFFMLLATDIVAQTIFGKIIDLDNGIEITNVQILNSKNEIISSSDEYGLFTLPKTGFYIFNKTGFYPAKVTITNLNFIILTLKSIPQDLNEIQIISNNFKSNLNKIPTSIAVISNHEFLNNNVHISPILNKVSGVFMQNGTYTTNKIIIRGIGSRNLFGTSKIKAYFEDIPLTNGSGESTIEDIELSAIGRIEIIKGPSSSMYGSGLGGTIHLIPNKGTIGNTILKSGISFGSFGLQKYMIQTIIGSEKTSASMVYSNTQSTGYRANNNTSKQSFTIASNFNIDHKNELTFIGNYIDLKAFIPSSIDLNNFYNNPKMAAINWSEAKGFEDYTKGLFGVSWKHNYNSNTKHSTNLFYSFLDSYEARPFNILKDKTTAFGIRTKLTTKAKLFKNQVEWIVGGELFNDIKKYKTLANLYRSFPPETGSVEGNLLSDFKENRTYFNLFFDSKYQLSDKTQLNFGINLNQTSYILKDNFNAYPIDFSGKFNFKAILSPTFGITYQVVKNSMIYGSVGHGFSSPTLEEILLPDNTLNSTIKPEKGWNFEIGSRGRLLNNKLTFEIAVFKMNIKNLLVAKRISEDQFVGVNAGETHYKGLELGLHYNLLKNENAKIELSNILSFNNFKFKEFMDYDTNHSGNKLPGIPNLTQNSTITAVLKSGLYGKIEYNYVGKIPMRDDNSIFSKKYQLVNSGIGFKTLESKKLTLDIFIGINNLFNEKHASMLLINASSFGTALPRYYYPGKSLNHFSSINLKYNLPVVHL